MWSLVSRSTQDGIRVYDLKPGITSLGRGVANTIITKDALASRFHCEIDFNSESQILTLRDLGSKNGTFLNGKPVNSVHVLEADDQVRVGSQVFELHLRGVKTKPIEDKGRMRTRPLTSELVLHSIDRHTILLNEIAENLNTVTDLESAISQVTELTKVVLGVDHCTIVLAPNFDQMKHLGIPRSIARPAIEEQQVVLIQGPQKREKLGRTGLLQGVITALCVPVQIEKAVAAILYMDKSKAAAIPFTEMEMELAIGISHQLALAIQRKNIEAELLKNALYDSLTVLPNQSLFISYLEKAAARAARETDFSFAVISLDLDEFKLVNDFYGYPLGDEALVLLARRLNGFLPEKDSLARMGSDEFAILLHGVKEEDEALKFARALHKIIAKPITLNDRQVNLNAGMGISLSTLGYEKPIDLLRNAETAMYRAKEKGHAETAIFNQSMRDRSIARLNLDSKLSQALEKEEFRVHYQPIVSIEKSNIVGFEALVRWQQSHGSLIAAGDFISLAEQTQFIFDIDMIVLRAASRQLKEWQKIFTTAAPIWVSVNLSSRHISNRALIESIEEILSESGLNPTNLNLEFTEKSLMEEDSETILVLNKLKDMGVRMSIDDFGTGYSSLSYLRHFPVNYIKLDRTFTFEEDWDIASSIIDLAHKLDLEVIAEGVEKQDHLDRLRDMQCDYAQGNYFSPDVDSDKAALLINQTGTVPLG